MHKYLLNISASCLTINYIYHEFTHLEDHITLEDVRAALKRMVTGKAARPSGITPNALKSMVWREEGAEAKADELANANADYL
eukprot:9223260-Ditylum_brightwellii.AAC.1